MRVKRLAWLGTRTEEFDETVAFFRDVLGLSLHHEEPGFSMFRLPGADRDFVEVFAADREDVGFYTTGPVVGLLVDDVAAARDELGAAGLELLGEARLPDSPDGYGWFHFRGPDGNVYAVLQGSEALPG